MVEGILLSSLNGLTTKTEDLKMAQLIPSMSNSNSRNDTIGTMNQCNKIYTSMKYEYFNDRLIDWLKVE